MDPKTRHLVDLLFCYGRQRRTQLVEHNKLIAHYTTADTAMKILTGRSLWLRNAAVMNDFSEIEYGKSIMKPVLNGPTGERYKRALDAIYPGLGDEVYGKHEIHRDHAREAIFTASLSEYEPDDNLGRLSMWRAYGGSHAGVALLFHGWTTQIELEPDLEVAAAPVLYGDTRDFAREFDDAATKIENNISFMKEFPRDLIAVAATLVLQQFMFSIKHPGFKEEREWRLIYRPYQYPSPAVVRQTVTINGVPQHVFEFPFHDPDKGPLKDIPQLALDQILAGIILGPCAYPETIYRSFLGALEEMNITEPRKRLISSDIPLRQRW